MLWVNRKKRKSGITDDEKAAIVLWIAEKGVTICPPAYAGATSADIGQAAKAFHKERHGGLNAIEKLIKDQGDAQGLRNKNRSARRIEMQRQYYVEKRRISAPTSEDLK